MEPPRAKSWSFWLTLAGVTLALLIGGLWFGAPRIMRYALDADSLFAARVALTFRPEYARSFESLIPAPSPAQSGALNQYFDQRPFPVYMAALFNRPNVVAALLERGALPLASPFPGSTAYHVAASNGDLRALRALIDAAPTIPGQAPPFSTALMSARRLECVQMLLRAGADPNARVEGEGNALGSQIEAERVDCVAELLRAGADPNALARRTPDGWRTPLALAASQGGASGEAMVRMLLVAGADPAAASPDGKTPLDLAATEGSRIAIEDAISRPIQNGSGKV